MVSYILWRRVVTVTCWRFARSGARYRLRLARRRGLAVSHAQYVKNMSTQEQVDELGGNKSISAWEARFDLAYKCTEENVT